jgi:hypothetical protein
VQASVSGRAKVPAVPTSAGPSITDLLQHPPVVANLPAACTSPGPLVPSVLSGTRCGSAGSGRSRKEGHPAGCTHGTPWGQSSHLQWPCRVISIKHTGNQRSGWPVGLLSPSQVLPGRQGDGGRLSTLHPVDSTRHMGCWGPLLPSNLGPPPEPRTQSSHFPVESQGWGSQSLCRACPAPQAWLTAGMGSAQGERQTSREKSIHPSSVAFVTGCKDKNK